MNNGIDLQGEIQKMLEKYGEEVLEIVEEEAPKAAKEAAKKLNAKKSFAAGSHASGKYAKGWTTMTESQRTGVSATVYNAKYPGLAHLLENGHATRNGTGRSYPATPAYPHIGDVNEETQQDFVDAIERRVGE